MSTKFDNSDSSDSDEDSDAELIRLMEENGLEEAEKMRVIDEEYQRIEESRRRLPRRERTSSKEIVSIFLDISSHGGSCINTTCNGIPGLKLDDIEITVNPTEKPKPEKPKPGKKTKKSATETSKKTILVETISGTFLGTPFDEIVKPIVKSRSTKHEETIKEPICTWNAEICHIPEEYPIYSVNAPCCVGSGTPARGTCCMTNGLCDPTEYKRFLTGLNESNILYKMVSLSRTFHDTLETANRIGFGCDAICPDSLRINHQLESPVTVMLNKDLQCQQEVDDESYIDLYLLLKDGTQQKFCLLTSQTDSRITILDETKILVDIIGVRYPKCVAACEKYKRALDYRITPGYPTGLDIKLSDILQLIYSLIDNYGDNTDIYMADFSCWITNEYDYHTDSATPIVKKINALLTKYLTEENILHGGKSRKARKSLRKKLTRRNRLLYRFKK